jgi:membrane-bound serine protease (ClpP class)
VLLTLAIIGLFVLPDPWRVVFVVAAAFIEVGEVYLWIRFLRRYRVTTGAEGMLGERAEVIDACEPDGRVRLRGEIWTARSSQPVRRGERVRVTGVEGLTLTVVPDRG